MSIARMGRLQGLHGAPEELSAGWSRRADHSVYPVYPPQKRRGLILVSEARWAGYVLGRKAYARTVHQYVGS